MLSEDSFHYALENTRVIQPPQNRLETFGTSSFNYYLVTEDMDDVTLSRVREGQIHAEKPQILSPQYFARLLLEGFGEKGEAFAEHINRHAHQFAFLKYGFRMRKADTRSYDVHEPLDSVVGKVMEHVKEKNDPMATILTGVDDGWEVCLLKFMMDIIQSSAGGNLKDFRDRGLL